MSTIRLFKASSYYAAFLNDFAKREPAAAGGSYEAFHQALLGRRYSWSDYWKRHLESTGDFEVEEVVLNSPGQRLWAAEHGEGYREPQWMGDILMAQVKAARPDVVFLHENGIFDATFRKELLAAVPSVRVLISYDGIDSRDLGAYGGTHLMLSCSHAALAYYATQGIRPHFMKQGFEHTLPEEIGCSPRRNECVFTGSIGLGPNLHNQRVRILAGAARATPFRLHLNVPTRESLLRSLAKPLVTANWSGLSDILRHLPDYISLVRNRCDPVFGRDMLQVLGESACCLNVHIDAARNQAGNMRLFEVTGMGCCLVTDRKDNLGESFEEDSEVVAFGDAEECIEKLRYLHDHPAACAEIALRGQQRTLGRHRLKEQILEIGEVIRSMLGRS